VSAARKAGPSRGRPRTFAEFRALLDDLESLTPLERARAIPPLIDAFKGAAAAERRTAIAEAVAAYQSGGLSRGGRAEVARQLGISPSKVSEALNDLDHPAR
jgi:hypothetical protein